jgi:hypothetical protein
MNAKQLAAIAVRLYALHLLLTAILRAESSVVYRMHRNLSLPDAAASILLVVLALVLFVYAEPMARRLAPHGEHAFLPAALSTSELQLAGFALVGVIFLVNGLTSVAGLVAYVLAPPDPLSPLTARGITSSVAAGTAKIFLGLWLFLGARGIANFASRFCGPSSSQSADA